MPILNKIHGKIPAFAVSLSGVMLAAAGGNAQEVPGNGSKLFAAEEIVKERIEGALEPERIPDSLVFRRIAEYLTSLAGKSVAEFNFFVEETIGLESVDTEQLFNVLESYKDHIDQASLEELRSFCTDQLVRANATPNASWIANRLDQVDQAVRTRGNGYFISNVVEAIGIENYKRLMDWADATFRSGSTATKLDIGKMLSHPEVDVTAEVDRICRPFDRQ